MTLEQCNHCIKINKTSKYCAYHMKYITKIESCERVIEYQSPQCSKHNCSMDMEEVNKNSIVFKCMYCDEQATIILSKEYKEQYDE